MLLWQRGHLYNIDLKIRDMTLIKSPTRFISEMPNTKIVSPTKRKAIEVNLTIISFFLTVMISSPFIECISGYGLLKRVRTQGNAVVHLQQSLNRHLSKIEYNHLRDIPLR